MASSVGHSGLIVLDDFYEDWLQIREVALRSTFEAVPNVSLSYVHASPPKELVLSGVNRILGIIGERYRTKFLESHFFLGSKNSANNNFARNAWIHFDRCRWVGVVYLNTPEQCRGGTSFYMHARTKIHRWEQLMIKGNEVVKDVMSDSAKLSAWRETARVGMVPNRLLLFDSRQFHQATEYFGEGVRNSRLTQHFYFDEIPDSEMNLDWKLGS